MTYPFVAAAAAAAVTVTAHRSVPEAVFDVVVRDVAGAKPTPPQGFWGGVGFGPGAGLGHLIGAPNRRRGGA